MNADVDQFVPISVHQRLIHPAAVSGPATSGAAPTRPPCLSFPPVKSIRTAALTSTTSADVVLQEETKDTEDIIKTDYQSR
jgi:hypothetical protein